MAEEKVAEEGAVESAGVESGGDAPVGWFARSRRAARRAYRAEIVFAVGLSLYAVLAVLANRYAYFSWDLMLARRIQSIALPGFETFMVWISALGSGWMPPALVICAGLALVAMRLRLEGIICMAGAGVGAGINRLLKYVIGRPRPDNTLVQVITEYGAESFPSGHVFFFMEFFGFLFFLSYVLLKIKSARRAAFVILGALISLVGVSRVYMGAHWPSDVAGAYLAGGCWLLLVIEIYRRLKSKNETDAGPAYNSSEVL